MMHDRRIHRVTDVELDSLDDLATRLQGITQTLCSGFRWNGLLILNDATSEDGAQEYAVVREATGRQVESLTCSWYETPDRLAADLRALADGTHWAPLDEDANSNPVALHLDHPEGTCHLCA